jgi:hypothetical protein
MFVPVIEENLLLMLEITAENPKLFPYSLLSLLSPPSIYYNLKKVSYFDDFS